jgi:hypothetical protein
VVSGQLAGDWTAARRKLIRAIRRPDRDRYDTLVTGLLDLVERGRPTVDERARGLLRVGVATASALVPYAPADLELLAAAAVLPWFDDALLGSRALLLAAPGPPDWTTAMLLAMAPPAARSMREATTGDRGGYLRHLAGLPPLPRAAVVLERHFAAGVPEVARLAFGTARPFDQAEQAVLAPGVPSGLLPPAAAPGPPVPPAPPPVGSPAEAVTLVREQSHQPFGGYRLAVDGDPGFLVAGRELVYQVRWDAPPDAFAPVGPAVSYPGDPEPVAYREPGWLVDRATREVHPVDLSIGALAGYVGPRRAYPLPPGWRPDARPVLPDGFAALLATLAPPLVPEATARYAARLAGPDWPDLLVALRVAGYTIQALAAAGLGAAAVAAALAARGPGPEDTLVDPDSAQWRTPAGELARAVAAHATLAGADPTTRAVAVANARARAAVEHEQFGAMPRARHEELAALAPLAADLPAPLRQGLPVR